MTPEVEKAIHNYLNSPTGTIKTVYPAIDHVDFKFTEGEEYFQGMPYPELSHDYITVKIYMKYPVKDEDELWFKYNVDPYYLMDHWVQDTYKLFGEPWTRYEFSVFSPVGDKWKEIMFIGMKK